MPPTSGWTRFSVEGQIFLLSVGPAPRTTPTDMGKIRPSTESQVQPDLALGVGGVSFRRFEVDNLLCTCRSHGFPVWRRAQGHCTDALPLTVLPCARCKVRSDVRAQLPEVEDEY